MKKAAVYAVCAVLALAVLLVCGYSAGMLSRTAPAFSDNNPVTVVIDAGHGGEDGGASSKSGVLELSLIHILPGQAVPDGPAGEKDSGKLRRGDRDVPAV